MNKKNLSLAKIAIKNSITRGKLDPTKIKKQIALILKSKDHQMLAHLKIYKKLLIAKLIKEQVIVSSAFELDLDLKGKLDAYIQTNFENFLSTDYTVDKNLTGGLKIQIGDQIIDSTINSNLELLNEEDD